MNKIILSLILFFSVGAQAAGNSASPTAAKPTTVTAMTTDGKLVNVTLTKDNMIAMDDYFDSETTSKVAQRAKEMDSKLKSNEPLFLVVNSGGGEIDSGIEMIENLNSLNRPVHTITIFSASMGFQTVQGIKGKRLVLENGTLMSHKARGGFYGEFPGQLDSRYSYYLRKINRLDAQAVRRTNGKHTLKSYASLIENEYWCDGEDCISQGFADNIARVSCNDSLNGTHDKLWDRFLYMGHVIEIVDVYSDCPVITGALSWQVYIDGEPLFEQYKVKPEPAKNKKDEYDYYYGRRVSKAILADLGQETAENIKKQITKKVNSRTTTDKRDVRKY